MGENSLVIGLSCGEIVEGAVALGCHQRSKAAGAGGVTGSQADQQNFCTKRRRQSAPPIIGCCASNEVGGKGYECLYLRAVRDAHQKLKCIMPVYQIRPRGQFEQGSNSLRKNGSGARGWILDCYIRLN